MNAVHVLVETIQERSSVQTVLYLACSRQDFRAFLDLLEDMGDKVLDEAVDKLNGIVNNTENLFFTYIMVVTLFVLIAIYVACW